MLNTEASPMYRQAVDYISDISSLFDSRFFTTCVRKTRQGVFYVRHDKHLLRCKYPDLDCNCMEMISFGPSAPLKYAFIIYKVSHTFNWYQSAASQWKQPAMMNLYWQRKNIHTIYLFNVCLSFFFFTYEYYCPITMELNGIWNACYETVERKYKFLLEEIIFKNYSGASKVLCIRF